MDQKYFGVIEMIFSFGVILAIGFQQLYSVNRAKKKLRDKRAEDETKRKDGA